VTPFFITGQTMNSFYIIPFTFGLRPLDTIQYNTLTEIMQKKNNFLLKPQEQQQVWFLLVWFHHLH